MENNAPLEPPSGTVLITTRVTPEMAGRIDQLAAHCGRGRSAFVRLALVHAEETMKLAELAALEEIGALSAGASETRAKARSRLADVTEALKPKPLVSA